MKILIFTETYLPTVNGVVNSIELFRAELEKRGHRVFVVAPHSKSEGFKSRPHVFRLLSLPVIGQPSHPLAWPRVSQVDAIVQEIKPDIIHVQGMASCGWMGKKAAKNAGIPHLLTYHTLLEGYVHYAGPLAFIAKPLLNWWTKIYANDFDLVITPTPSMAKFLKKHGVKTDIVALPTGIELKDYQPAEKLSKRKELGFKPETIYLFTAGRLAQEKNINQVIVDFGRLQARGLDVHLNIAGDGPDRKAFEENVKKLGIDGRVTFLGTLKKNDLISYYEASDIFCFPSLTDTQGIVLIEAMAGELPCVVYNALGPGDIVKHEESGLKAEPGTDQFYQNLLALCQDHDLREKLGVGALREVRKYSIEKTAEQLEQLYQVLTNHK